MNAKLFLATLLAEGHTIPDNAHDIAVGYHEVDFYAAEPFEQTFASGRIHKSELIYGASIEFDNPQVAYDRFTMEFSDNKFTVEEFNEWLAENQNVVEVIKAKQQVAVKRLAELAETINACLQEGEALANDLCLPFMVKLGGSLQDVRKLAAVDWDSSSMYC